MGKSEGEGYDSTLRARSTKQDPAPFECAELKGEEEKTAVDDEEDKLDGVVSVRIDEVGRREEVEALRREIRTGSNGSAAKSLRRSRSAKRTILFGR